MYDKIQYAIDKLLGKEGMQFYPWTLLFGLIIVSSFMRCRKSNTL